MLCKDCRFSLPCYAGRLDGDDAELLMCPVCEKLVITKHTGPQEITLYYLECEHRPYRPLFRDAWRDPRHVTLMASFERERRDWAKNPKGPPPSQPHQIAEQALEDPMGSIARRIRIKPCWHCNRTENIPALMRDLHFKRVDLDELAKEEERRVGTKHAWSLTPRKS